MCIQFLQITCHITEYLCESCLQAVVADKGRAERGEPVMLHESEHERRHIGSNSSPQQD